MTAARVPYQTAVRTLLRDTVLASVDELARTRGWAATTMADVARAAGVSRQTLYNEFGSRLALVEAYVASEIESILTQVDATVRAHPTDPHEALRKAFTLFLQLASDETVVRIILTDAEGGELQRLLTGLGQSIATERVTAVVSEVWSQVNRTDAELLADTLVRLAISHALVPGRPAELVASDVARMLGSYVDEILSNST